MSRQQYKVDTDEIKNLRDTLEDNTYEIINGHKSTKRNLESKLNSVSREYGNCSSIMNCVESIKSLLKDTDYETDQIKKDIDILVDGLDFTIRSTRDSQNEINSIMRDMEMPSFDRLNDRSGSLHINTSNIKVETGSNLMSDILANSMIGNVPINISNNKLSFRGEI